MKTKRIKALLLCLLLILNTFGGTVSAAEGEYNKEDIFLLKDDFDYSPDTSDSNLSWTKYETSYISPKINTITKSVNAVNGWAENSGWSIQNYAESDGTTYSKWRFQWDKASGAKVLQVTAASAYRKLEKPISYGTNGVYYIAVDCAPNVGNPAFISQIDSRFLLGSDTRYVGLKYNADGVYAQLSLDGTTTLGKIAYTTSSANKYRFVAKIEIDSAAATATYKFKVFPVDGVEPSEWELAGTAAIDTTKSITYFGFGCPSTAPNAPFPIYGIYGEKYTGKYYTILSDYNAVLQKAENETLEEADIVNQMAVVSDLFDCYAKTEILNGIPAIAKENDFEDALANKVTASNPEKSSRVYCEDIENITIEYRYNLKSVGDIATISDGESTINGDVVLEGKNITITPEEPLSYNKSYTVTLSDAVNFDGNAISDNAISFTTSIVPPVNLKDGETYGVGRKIEWDTYTGITTTATVKIDGAEEAPFTNGAVLSEQGEYVFTLYSAEDDGEKTEEREFSFTVLPAYPPEAKDLKIKGTMATDETIEAVYDFVDKNNDSEDEAKSEYQWYRADKINGEYKPITTNGTSKTYTLTKDDENKYLKYSVIPVALSDSEKTGEKVESEPYAGPFKPTAESITVKAKDGKKLKENSILEASFSYNDLNGNENEGEHSYTWYAKDNEGEEKIGEGKTYKITKDVFNKQIFVKVVPKSTLKPYDGDEETGEVIYAPTKPTAKNVEITGTAKVGKTIGGVYTFYDVNGDDEAETTGYWIDAESEDKIADGHSLKLTSKHEGMKIKYVVVTESTEEPKEGEKVESSSVKIEAAGSGGGGGGLSYNGSTSGSIKTETKDPAYEIKPTEPKPEVNKDSFNDLKGHWAEESIKELKKAGLINGVSETEFAPAKNVSRAEFVSMMVRLAGWEKAAYKDVFDDVKTENWFSADVITAFEKGLISEGSAFRPSDSITRAEVAKLSSIIAELLGYNASESNTEAEFADSTEIPAWATEYIKSANEKGIMLGDDNGNIRANDNMTRAEAATILWRLYKGGKA